MSTSEPSVSMFSRYALAYRDDEELLSEVISQMSPADCRMALHISLMAQAQEIPQSQREHAAQVASTMAARAGESQ